MQMLMIFVPCIDDQFLVWGLAFEEISTVIFQLHVNRSSAEPIQLKYIITIFPTISLSLPSLVTSSTHDSFNILTVFDDLSQSRMVSLFNIQAFPL
jgi:hypothetical protein